MNTVEKILEKNDKLIIVSQWSSFLKVIAKNLDDYHDANYAMFTGEVAVKDRQVYITFCSILKIIIKNLKNILLFWPR